MIKQTIAGTYHAISILALMAFNPALLFQKINALPWYQEALHNWLASVSINKGDTLLEAGCATGQLVQYMSSRGVIVHGVDKSAQMLQQAHKFNTDAATFALASVMDLPYESNRFDFIIAASLINVVAEPEIALREMVRVCATRMLIILRLN
jgi:ubiquinone/menaquinone biosynthesis C-methylase UbiE